MNDELRAFYDGLGAHSGYAGVFSRAEAKGALANGTRIRKCNSEEGDGTPDGTGGVILGSVNVRAAGVSAAEDHGVTYLYFVEWDNRPKVAVGTIDVKIEEE
jgi:hypothetical protein